MARIELPGVQCGSMGTVEILTEGGIAIRVVVEGHELRGVTNVNICYGVDLLPEVTVTFIAKDIVIERNEEA